MQADNGDSSTTLNRQQIAELPNPGNDLTYIVQSAPGVVMNTDLQGYANFSVLGMPGTSNLFTIDGTNNNDNATNFNLSGSLDSSLTNQIQEATVVSTGYSGQLEARPARILITSPNQAVTSAWQRSTTGARPSMRTAGSAMYFKPRAGYREPVGRLARRPHQERQALLLRK